MKDITLNMYITGLQVFKYLKRDHDLSPREGFTEIDRHEALQIFDPK